ncbi:MAG: Wadjet anti-phage system protein JetD domain-containing protein [Candidatus Rokuibacteriota bacterium]
MAGDRREWHGRGGDAPEGVERVLAPARGGKQCHWDGIGRRVGRGHDQVDVEQILWTAVDAGLAVVLERRTRRGDWEPYRWRLTENGEALVARKEEPIDVVGFLSEADDPNHPVLAAIRMWLAQGGRSPTCTRIVVAIGQELRAGRVPRERLLSTRVAGYSKAIRIGDYREELEDALGLPIEEFVRKSGDAAIVAGPIRFRVNGIESDARGIPPWLALPIETVEAIERISIEADRLVTIENLAAFEEEVRRGLAPRTIALYLGGFAGRVERRMLDHLVASGIGCIDHWSDLDVGGLRILRQLRSLVPIEVRPYRMEVDLLGQLPTQRLTENDKAALRAWIADKDAPDRELAQALLAAGRKAEQEGWLLVHRTG